MNAKMRSIIANPFFPLLLFSIVLSVLFSASEVLGASPSAEVEVLIGFIWAILLAMWMVSDARQQRGVPCYDFGLFVYLFLPYSVLCYCLWSRGWRGVATLAKVIGVMALPYFIAAIVWQLLYANWV